MDVQAHVIPIGENPIRHQPSTACTCRPDLKMRIDFADHGDHAHIGWTDWTVIHRPHERPGS